MLRAVTDSMMAEIANLSGQEYVPEVYAKRAKEQLRRQMPPKGPPGHRALPEKELPPTLSADPLQDPTDR